MIYPPDFKPPNRGKCKHEERGKICGRETRSYDRRWLDLCPEHWQALLRMRPRT